MVPTHRAGTEPVVDQDPFTVVLADAVTALDGAGHAYGLIGGVASAVYGRPRFTHDIDVFCRAAEAEDLVATLERHGFEVELTNPSWIYKAVRHEVVVDVIFRAKAEIYFDDDMAGRVRRMTFGGVEVPVVAPEDIVVTKAITADETSPAHWWDALSVLATTDLDWDYLVERACKGPNRVASLLHFALSVDLPIPVRALRQLDDLVNHRLDR